MEEMYMYYQWSLEDMCGWKETTEQLRLTPEIMGPSPWHWYRGGCGARLVIDVYTIRMQCIVGFLHSVCGVYTCGRAELLCKIYAH